MTVPTEGSTRYIKNDKMVMLFGGWYSVGDLQKIIQSFEIDDADRYKSAEPCHWGMVEVAA